MAHSLGTAAKGSEKDAKWRKYGSGNSYWKGEKKIKCSNKNKKGRTLNLKEEKNSQIYKNSLSTNCTEDVFSDKLKGWQKEKEKKNKPSCKLF